MKLLITALCLILFQTAVAAATKSDADSVFSWAELNYPTLFASKGQVSQSNFGYYYRYYPETNSYLGFREDDQKIYYLPDKGTPTPVGSIDIYLPMTAIPPSTSAELNAYLQAGIYKNWVADPAVHGSVSAHGGRAKIFFNPSLVDTLTKRTNHLAGAASVKELYSSDDKHIGWAVEVKTQADSNDGKGWYWYEVFSKTPGVRGTEGFGNPTCTGCHSSGRDYVRARLPQ